MASVFSRLGATALLLSGIYPLRLPAVELATGRLVYGIGEDGLNHSIRDRRTGKEYLARRSSFMSIVKNGVRFGSTSVQSQGNKLHVKFGDSGVESDLKVVARSEYLTFEIVSINDHSFASIEMANLPLTLTKYVSQFLASSRDDEYGVAVIPLNIETHSRVAQGTLIAEADGRVRLETTKFALIGCPASDLLNDIEHVEIQNGLPHPMLKGIWARKSLDQRRSYLFVDLTEATTSGMIDYAKQGGFGYIVIQDGTWNASHGTYTVNRTNFPHGEAGLKAAVDKIHAAGLKAGIHNLDMVVDKDDPLVRPVPSSGFMMYPDRGRTLAAAIDSEQRFLPTTASPLGLLAKDDKSRYYGRDLRVGDEIITYNDLRTTPPFGFTDCIRGAHGTRAMPHPTGAAIENFSEFIGFYRPDVKGPLYDRVAKAEAEVLDKFGFDYIYPDGTGENLGMWPDQPAWYIYNLLISKLFNYTKREVLWAHAPVNDYSWHIFSRGNTTDYVNTGVIEHFDRVSLAGARDSIAELQPFELGWFGYLTYALDAQATRPREIEYAWSKALAYGAAMSLETTKSSLDANGRTSEIFARIKNWEHLKLTNYFPRSIRDQLKMPGREFTLARASRGQWSVLPLQYSPEKYVSGNDRWIFENRYAAQPLRVNIDARPSLAGFGSGTNIVLIDPGKPIRVQTSGSGPMGEAAHQTEGFSFDLKTQDEAFHVVAFNGGSAPAGWGCDEILLDSPKDLRKNRSLGTWVEGDGSGAYLHFVLEDASRWLVRDYYVRLDFKGRRYVEMREPAKGEIYDFSFPYSNYWALRNINFGEISRIYVFLTGVSPGRSAEARFSRLEALREENQPVQDITIKVNGDSVIFPVRLETDWYLEYAGQGKIHVFDANGFTRSEVVPKGAIPVLRPGSNHIEFLCEKCSAKVTLIGRGEPLRR